MQEKPLKKYLKLNSSKILKN